MRISLIAVLDEDEGLGKDNQLLCHLPADLKYFKEITLGKPILMGYNTFESIGRALPGRKNIVLTSKQNLQKDNVFFVHSLDEGFDAAGEVDELMIIGGAQIYLQTLSRATRLYITALHHRFSADVFFPPFDKNEWRLTSETHHQRDEKNPYDFSFLIYDKENENNV